MSKNTIVEPGYVLPGRPRSREEKNKSTNPKDRIGSKKVDMSTVPPNVLAKLALAHMDGAIKYGAFNWREKGVRSSIYYSAALRHLLSWWEGEDTAPDSGQHHLAHVMACCAILLDAEECSVLTDDRPPDSTRDGWLDGLNEQARRLVEKGSG